MYSRKEAIRGPLFKTGFALNETEIAKRSIDPYYGCTQGDYDKGNYTGGIVIVSRGQCNFAYKVYYAFQAGAIGLIVVNNYRTAFFQVNEGATTVDRSKFTTVSLHKEDEDYLFDADEATIAKSRDEHWNEKWRNPIYHQNDCSIYETCIEYDPTGQSTSVQSTKIIILRLG